MTGLIINFTAYFLILITTFENQYLFSTYNTFVYNNNNDATHSQIVRDTFSLHINIPTYLIVIYNTITTLAGCIETNTQHYLVGQLYCRRLIVLYLELMIMVHVPHTTENDLIIHSFNRWQLKRPQEISYLVYSDKNRIIIGAFPTPRLRAKKFLPGQPRSYQK